jgi:hypothetical protein
MSARLAFLALRLVRYGLTVTLRIRTAAMVAMRQLTKAMDLSMVLRHWPLSRPSLLKATSINLFELGFQTLRYLGCKKAIRI